MSFNHKKRFGQNFLKNKFIISKIVDALPLNIDNVFEIGPGIGALTNILLARGYKICAIELDKDCIEILKSYNHENLQLINADILAYEIPENAYVIGNLPYNIGTKIIEKFFYRNINIGVFMLQKEVAQRILGQDYCRLSVLVQAFYNVEKIINVSKDDFVPKPKVESQVIKITKHNCNPNIDLKLLNDMTKIIFQFPRKKLTFLKNFPKILELFQMHNISLNLRAEEICKEDFYKMCIVEKKT